MAYGGPRLYRFYNYEQVHYIPAPVAGWNPGVNPWEMPLNQAVQLDNFVMQSDKIVMRGPVQTAFDFTTIGLNPVAPVGWVFGDSAPLASHRTQITIIPKNTAGGAVDHWHAPLLKRTSSADLGTPGSFCVTSANNGSSWTKPNITADAPGPRSIQFGSKVYGLNYASSAPAITDVSGNYVVWPVQMWLADIYNTNARTNSTVAPKGGMDITQHLSRLWILGGQDAPGGGTTFNPNVLFFTNPIASGGGNVGSDWQDPISGLTNQILVDPNDDDYGVGLAKVRNGLLIFKRNSVWILLGTTTTSFAIKLMSKEMGCIDARSIVEADGGVYFMSLRGYMFTDGITIRNVSGPLTYLLQNLTQQITALASTGPTTNAPYVTSSTLASGHIVLSIGYTHMGGFTPGEQLPMLAVLFDPTTGGWSRLTSQVWTTDTGNTTPGIMIGSAIRHGTYVVGNKYFTRVEDVTRNISITGLMGASSSGLYDDFGVGSPEFVSIPALWKSGYVPLTAQRKQGQAKRFFCDYAFAADGTLIPTTGWSVQPVDAVDTSLGNAMNVALGSLAGNPLGTNVFAAVTSPPVQHQNKDFTNEITDLGFTLSWSDAGRGLQTGGVATIYGVGVEFQRTRDLR